MNTIHIDPPKVPTHIAIIMDGNGRWAKKQGEQRTFGHHKGVDAVRIITKAAGELGVDYLTLYAFSTENWNRPIEEVQVLMSLFVETIFKETPMLIENNVRLRMIGDLNRLYPESRAKLLDGIEATKACTGLTLTLALSYSSRWEITEAARSIAQSAVDGKVDIEAIDQTTVEESLNTAQMPDVDLMIRTGGEMRISNFLLWQSAYAELYFTSVLWPDFDKTELERAISDYQQRERRYGMISEQIQ